MLREAFCYLLGGVTFLPLCVIGILLHFYFNVPIEPQSASPSIDADVELTHEKKLAALDLAARNAAIHDEIEKAKGKDHPQGDATAPPAAKRLGAGPPTSTAPKPFSSGWLTVRPTFETDKDTTTANGAASNPATLPASLVEAESDVSRAHSDDESTAAESVDGDKPSSVAATRPHGPNAGAGYMSQMYRGILDYRIGRAASKKPSNDAHARSKETASGSGATPTGTAGKESFYCILKSPILYLYSSDDTANPNTECHAAIDLRGKRVSIFVAGLGDTLGDLDPEQPAAAQAASTDNEQSGDALADQEAFDPSQAWKTAKRAAIRDGELFMKRNAIRIVGSALGRNSSSKRASKLNQRRPQWFIFCKNNYVMEDWYHALLQASLMPDPSLSTNLSENSSADPLSQIFAKLDDPIGPTFSQEDMASLLVSLDSFPDPLPLRWLNALVGRIFFSVYRTAWLEDYIVSKMMKKINRVKTPGFLNDIKVVEVDVGRRAPGFSRPMLKALTSEGEASMEVAVHYIGEVRITISCTLTLSLGSRFKPYTIPIVLAVVLRSLEGNLLLHVKRPPSNRLWFGFTTLPKMDIDVEPVVSERKVQWGMVTRLIESRIRELLTESIVVPNMDDISFFNTRSLPLRGGIFADAAKKTDLHRAESNGTSSTAATTAPAATVTEQSKDGKSSALSVKTSELLKADRVGTASAPVSGASTPSTADRATMPPAGEASSISTDAASENALRNRKGGAEASSLLKEPSLQSARTSSPAAAGLSDLLSRDLAASAGSSGTSPPRQDSQSSKRRTWFGGGPKSSVSSISSSSGLSTLGLSSASLGVRSNREHSSLALGNASIERPSQRPHSTSISGKTDSSLSAPTDIPSRPASESATRSASSSTFATSPNDVGGEGRSAKDVPLPLSPAAASLQADKTGDAKEGVTAVQSEPASKTPSLIVSSASEAALDIEGANQPHKSSLNTGAGLDMPTQHDDEHDFVDSPASLTHSARSSIHSLKSDAVNPDLPLESAPASSAASLKEPPSVASSRQTSSEFDGHDSGFGASAASAQRGMPPPPPPRKPVSSARDDRVVPRQDAALALSSVHRSRYGLNDSETSLNDGSNGPPGSTSAMLLTSWNKAKASMADKESRQAAARDAKDAIKRGWANWNTKRTEARRGPQADDDADARSYQSGMNRSQSSRMSFVPGQSAWMASSPPDPTSFGLGFDKSSPENTRSTLRDRLNSATQYGGTRSNLTDTDDDNGSVHSNSSNRQPYRELRASKKVHGFDSNTADRAFSVSSSRLASTGSMSSATSATSAGGATSPSGLWDAEVPSLTPPKLALRNDRDDDKSAEPKRSKTLERTLSKDRSVPAPPALPQRKPSSSILPTAQSGGGVSFIPSAASVTTGLASASGLPHLDNATSEPESAVKSQVSDLRRGSASQTSIVSRKSDDVEPTLPNETDKTMPDTRHDPSSPSKQQSPDEAAAGSASTALSPEPNSQEAAKDPADITPANDKSSPDAEHPHVAESPGLASPTTDAGIKKQPGRATMMAIPGIPSMQKAGPQSFSAPAPPAPVPAAKNDAETSPSAFRASSLFKMPSFGSPVMAGGSPSKAMPGLGSDGSPARLVAAKSPPPVPVRPTSGTRAGDVGDAGSALGLVHAEERKPTTQDTAPTSSQSGAPQQPSTTPKSDGDSQTADDDTTFAEVAKAEGPAADAHFEHAQRDTGDTVKVGTSNREDDAIGTEDTVWQLQL